MKVKDSLPEKHIQTDETVTDWRSAVKLASQPLLDEALITSAYIEAMIQSVEENGPYMVLADYFALMHARPGEGVLEQSMSLLVTKQPIDLEGKPVRIFLVLAAADSQSHLESLKEIMAIFMDEEKYNFITYQTTLAFASQLIKWNPDMVFNFVSGGHTDSSEKGKICGRG